MIYIFIIAAVLFCLVPTRAFAEDAALEEQMWEDPCDRADILVFATHPDDEVLFMGGAIATYAAQGLRVQVVHMMNYSVSHPVREQERLDGMWTLGVRHLPLAGRFDASYSTGLMADGEIVGDNAVGDSALTEYVAEMIRRFKPQVVISHDLDGEYGHIRHRMLAAAVAEAVQHTMEEDFYPESAAEYGVWDVPKTYLHLYDENRIFLDLHSPLGGEQGEKTAIELAAEAYKKHVSQQWCWFYVSDDVNDPKSEQINAAIFGLFRSTVGPDTGNDMMENILSYDEQERIAAEEEAARIAGEKAALEKAEAERKAAEEARKQEEARRAAELKAAEEAAAKADRIAKACTIAALLLVTVFAHVIMPKLHRKR